MFYRNQKYTQKKYGLFMLRVCCVLTEAQLTVRAVNSGTARPIDLHRYS